MTGLMSVNAYALEEKDIIWNLVEQMSFPWVATFCFIRE